MASKENQHGEESGCERRWSNQPSIMAPLHRPALLFNRRGANSIAQHGVESGSAANAVQKTNPVLIADVPKESKEQLQNKMINEEYKIWKKNSVFLYDIMYR